MGMWWLDHPVLLVTMSPSPGLSQRGKVGCERQQMGHRQGPLPHWGPQAALLSPWLESSVPVLSLQDILNTMEERVGHGDLMGICM